MRKKYTITIEYDAEFDSEWYEDKDITKLNSNVLKDMNSEYNIDIILSHLENNEFKVNVKEQQ